MPIHSKSQSASEYLFVYGMALVIIVIAVAVLYQFGVFSIGTTTISNSVTGFTGFVVSQECVPGGALTLDITNDQTIPVEITSINATPSGSSAVSIGFSVILQSDQSQLFFVRNACSSTTNSRYSGTASISYITGSTVDPGPFNSSGTYDGISLASYAPAEVANFTYSNNGYIEIPNPQKFYFVSGVTVAIWINMQSAGTNYDSIFTKTHGAGRTWWFGIIPNTYSSFLNSNGVNPDIYENLAMSTSTWYFVVLEYNSTTGRSWYLNGNKVYVNTTETGNTLNSTSVVYLEGDPGWGTLNGKVSDEQVYSSTLTTAQVQVLYSEGIGGAPLSRAGLVGWWPLDGNANDYSGNGNNGIASNVQWVSP